MVTSSSNRVDFRTLQSICDLRTVARHTGDDILRRIAAGTDSPAPADDLRHLIQTGGCRIGDPQGFRLHNALVLAAALPDDDFPAFLAATTVLIADRLQHGLGSDDLFWHWDAFREHYALADPQRRAVILQGYDRMAQNGLVNLEDPPSPADLLTEERAGVADALAEEASVSAFAIRAAFDGADPDAGFWATHCTPYLDPYAPPVLLRGIRHLLESRPDWDPHDGDLFDPAESGLPVIRLDLQVP